MRLIDGDALTDEIMERYCKECDNRKGIKDGKYRIIYEVGDAPCRACHMDDMKDELDNAPTIEPERKTGRWNFIGDNLFECTCCLVVYSKQQLNGLRNDNSDPYIPRFCPNCGAKMER